MIGRREILEAAIGSALLGALDMPAFAARKPDDVYVNALVIGMAYARAPASFLLGNTVSDADLVAKFFQARGNAKVTLLEDPATPAFAQAVGDYAASLKPSDLVFIYYAGHGVQIGGTNYLVTSEGDGIVPVGALIELARKNAHLIVVVLDACRNNPFSAEESTPHTAGARTIRIVAPAHGAKPGATVDPIIGANLGLVSLSSVDLQNSHGLAQLRLSGPGVKVILSTDPGNVAMDEVEGEHNSPFTAALVRELGQRKSLDEVLAAVTHEVIVATNGRQTPWTQGSLDQTIYISGEPKRFDQGDVTMPVP